MIIIAKHRRSSSLKIVGLPSMGLQASEAWCWSHIWCKVACLVSKNITSLHFHILLKNTLWKSKAGLYGLYGLKWFVWSKTSNTCEKWRSPQDLSFHMVVPWIWVLIPKSQVICPKAKKNFFLHFFRAIMTPEALPI